MDERAGFACMCAFQAATVLVGVDHFSPQDCSGDQDCSTPNRIRHVAQLPVAAIEEPASIGQLNSCSEDERIKLIEGGLADPDYGQCSHQGTCGMIC